MPTMMEYRDLGEDFLRDEFNKQTLEFLKKVHEKDEEEEHKGIFLEYLNIMKHYESGFLSEDDVKYKVSVIFKNCDVLLDGFYELLKNAPCPSLSPLQRFMKMLNRETNDCEGLRREFIEIFNKYIVHDDVRVFKKEVDSVFRDYPLLREEFRKVLVDFGLLKEITAEEEDELFETDMYWKGLKSAIEFAEEEDLEKKVPVGVYGALRRFYPNKCNRFRYRVCNRFMRNPRVAVQSVLPALKRKYAELEEEKAIRHDSICSYDLESE